MLLLCFAAVLLLAVLVSNLAHRTILSTSVLFLAAGFVLGPETTGVLDLQPESPVVGTLAELALFAVLFTDGLQAGRGEDLLAEGPAVRRDGRQRDHRRRRGRDLRQDRGLRELRVRRVPLAQLRAARVRLDLPSAALPGSVPGRAAARPVDGVLLAPVPGRRRAPARCRRAAPGPAGLRGDRRPRGPGRGPAYRGLAGAGVLPDRSAAAHRVVRPDRPRHERRASPRRRLRRAARPGRREDDRDQGRRDDRERTRPGRPVPRHGRPGPAYRTHHDPGRSPRDSRGVPSGSPAARPCGRPAAPPRSDPTASPASAPPVPR